MWLINTKRGQHNGMMFVGGLGGWFRGAVVSAGVSGTGHSRSAAARPWSRCCPACGVQDWRHAGQVGRPCRVTKCMRHPRRIGCWQPGQGCRRCCCWVSGSMSPRQMGQGGMAGGVAAPGCVQPRSVGGASSMCPPSSSVKLTKEMFVGHAVGKGKIHGGGDKEIQRRTLRLYWPASRYASLFSTCFFFHFAVLKSTFCSLQNTC